MTTPSWTICTHILLDLIGQTCLFSRDHPFFNHYYDYNYLKTVYNIGQDRMEEPMIFYASIIKILTPSSLTLYGPSIMYKRGGELLAPITKCEKILKNCICRYLDYVITLGPSFENEVFLWFPHSHPRTFPAPSSLWEKKAEGALSSQFGEKYKD